MGGERGGQDKRIRKKKKKRRQMKKGGGLVQEPLGSKLQLWGSAKAARRGEEKRVQKELGRKREKKRTKDGSFEGNMSGKTRH